MPRPRINPPGTPRKHRPKGQRDPSKSNAARAYAAAMRDEAARRVSLSDLSPAAQSAILAKGAREWTLPLDVAEEFVSVGLAFWKAPGNARLTYLGYDRCAQWKHELKLPQVQITELDE